MKAWIKARFIRNAVRRHQLKVTSKKKSSGNLIQNQQYYGNQRRAYPDSRFTYEQNNSVQTDVIIEEWIYNFGSSRIQQSLRFENGKLMDIRNLGRGY